MITIRRDSEDLYIFGAYNKPFVPVRQYPGEFPFAGGREIELHFHHLIIAFIVFKDLAVGATGPQDAVVSQTEVVEVILFVLASLRHFISVDSPCGCPEYPHIRNKHPHVAFVISHYILHPVKKSIGKGIPCVHIGYSVGFGLIHIHSTICTDPDVSLRILM